MSEAAVMRSETGLQELRRKIDARGTQADFAERVSISPEHLSLILSGQRGVSTEVAIRISEAINMPISRFAGQDARKRAGAR